MFGYVNPINPEGALYSVPEDNSNNNQNIAICLISTFFSFNQNLLIS